MHIRKMHENDVPTIIEIEKNSNDTPWGDQIFYDCLKFYDCFVLEDNNIGEIVGCGIISRVLDEAHLLNIVISSNQQRKGLGTKLMKYLIDFVRGNNITTVYLEVKKSNLTAVHLYQKFNFKQIGVRKDYYKTKNGAEDALVFKLNMRT